MQNAWKLFEYKGVPIYLKYWFLGLLFFFSISWTISIFIGVLVHELAHAVKAKKLGYKTDYIFIDLFHGGALVDNSYLENDRHSISIAAAGPLSNLILSLSSFLLLTLMVSWDPSMNMESLSVFPKFLVEFTSINFLLFVGNLIPIYPLDGGRITKALSRMTFGEKRGTLINGVLSMILSLALLVYSTMTLDVILIILSVILVISSYTQINQKEDEQSTN